MKITFGSGEIDKYLRLEKTLFAPEAWASSRPITYEEVDKLNTWEDYKKEIKSLIGISCQPCIVTDKNGTSWVSMGFTGWGGFWSVN